MLAERIRRIGLAQSEDVALHIGSAMGPYPEPADYISARMVLLLADAVLEAKRDA